MQKVLTAEGISSGVLQNNEKRGGVIRLHRIPNVAQVGITDIIGSILEQYAP